MNKLTSPAQRASEIEDKIKENKIKVSFGIWEIGALLKEFQLNDYHIDLGFNSFTEWLSSPDIDFAPRTAFMFMDLHQTYIEDYEFTPDSLSDIDYSKLHKILPIIRGKDTDVVDEWVNKAKVLRRADLAREVREYQLSQKQLPASTTPEIKGVETSEVLLNSEPISTMEGLDAEMFDCVISYPPAPAEREIQTMMKEMSPDVQLSMQTLISSYHIKWLSQVHRLLKPNGSVFLVGNYKTIFPIAQALQTTGFHIIRDIVWTHSNKKPTAITTLIESHDTILWAQKGTQYTNNIADYTSDVWNLDLKPKTDHPRDLPERLISDIISIGTDEDAIILDPFAGAGTVPVMVKKLRRKYMAIEPDMYWFTVMTQRITEVV